MKVGRLQVELDQTKFTLEKVIAEQPVYDVASTTQAIEDLKKANKQVRFFPPSPKIKIKKITCFVSNPAQGKDCPAGENERVIRL